MKIANFIFARGSQGNPTVFPFLENCCHRFEKLCRCQKKEVLEKGGEEMVPLQESSEGTFGSIALTDFSGQRCSSFSIFIAIDHHHLKVKQVWMVLDHSDYIDIICDH